MGTQKVSLAGMQSIAQARMLHSRTVRWRTAFSYALVVLLIMAALAFFGLRLLAASALDARVADATQQTAATAQSPTLPPIWDDAKALTAQLSEWSTILNARGTAFALDGRPLADSAIPPQRMSTAIPRPEVRAAAAGGISLASSAPLEAAHAVLRVRIAPLLADRFLAPDITAAKALVEEAALVAAATGGAADGIAQLGDAAAQSGGDVVNHRIARDGIGNDGEQGCDFSRKFGALLRAAETVLDGRALDHEIEEV